jgi:drug/metabolite transporter (DMT)-like permease
VLAALGFSAKAIFVKLGYRHGAGADAMLALRMAFALPALLWMGWQASRSATAPVSRRDWLWLVALGLLGYYLSSLFDFIGLKYVSAALERLTLFLYPTLVLIFSMLLGKRYPARVWGAVLLAYCGIGVAFSHDLTSAGLGDQAWFGLLSVGASTVTYALYLVGSGEVMARFGAPRFTAYTMLASVVAVLMHVAITTPLSAFVLPWQAYGAAALMALFSTVLPVRWLNLAIRHIGAGKTASVGTLGPVLTMLLAWLVLREPMTVLQMTGALMVLAGVGLVGRMK